MMFGLHAHHHAAGMAIEADFIRRSFGSDYVSFASAQLTVISNLANRLLIETLNGGLYFGKVLPPIKANS